MKWRDAAEGLVPIRHLRTLALRVGPTLALVCLACAAILGVDGWHEHQQERARQVLNDSLQARADLDGGMLHLTLAGGVDSPWQRDTGLARVSQALRALAQVPAAQGPGRAQCEALAFGQVLARWQQGGPSDIDLRLGLHRLSEALDGQIAQQRQYDGQLRSDRQRVLRMVAVGAGLALLAVGLVLPRRTRGRVSEHAGPVAAEAAGEPDRGELEHRVAERTEALARTTQALRDELTDLRRTEQQLRQANEALVAARDRAEAASRAKSAFLAHMSHEIRTPMNAIIGLNHLLVSHLAGSPHVARLHKIGDAATHLLAIINDVLDLSKIESGTLELRPRDFELAELLERTLDLVRERALAKGLALQVEVGDVPGRLHGDATLLQQALVNLVGNAVKFTDQGWVRLSVQGLADTAPGLLRFAVTDTGPGVPAPLQGRLFEAFMQADNSSTRGHGGIGLGLAITRRIAEQMGGSAGLDSAPGQGSTFWITVRLEAALQPPGPDRTAARPRRQDVLKTDPPRR